MVKESIKNNTKQNKSKRKHSVTQKPPWCLRNYTKQSHVRHCDIRGFGCEFSSSLLFHTNYLGTLRHPEPPPVSWQRNHFSLVSLFFATSPTISWHFWKFCSSTMFFFLVFLMPLKMLCQTSSSLHVSIWSTEIGDSKGI